MWWFARNEKPPPGLPNGEYALFLKKEQGWFFVRSWPGNVKGERYREGPFPEKEDARMYAWQDAWDRGVRKKLQEK